MRKRKKAVPLVRPSSQFHLFFFYFSIFSFTAFSDPSSSCRDFPSHRLSATEPVLAAIVKQVLQSLKASDPTEIIPLFHPRLHVKKSKLQRVFQLQRTKLGPPFEVSTFNLLVLQSAHQVLEEIACESKDFLSVKSHYGYEREFVLVAQILGMKELAHATISLVPRKNGWVIGSFSWQMWTHDEKSYVDYVKEASQDLVNNNLTAAFIKYDIAIKLLGQNPKLTFKDSKIVGKVHQQLAKQVKLSKEIANVVPEIRILRVETAFFSRGIGLVIRYLQDDKYKNACAILKSRISTFPWFKSIKGFRCGGLFDYEDPAKDGSLGSILIQ